MLFRSSLFVLIPCAIFQPSCKAALLHACIPACNTCCSVIGLQSNGQQSNGQSNGHSNGQQSHELKRGMQKPKHTMCVIAGAQAYATDLTNNFTGNSTAFAAATARFSVVGQCLFNATIATDASASASATAVSTAISQSDATAASNAITGAICSPVTATATAQAFAQAIAQAQGCNGVIYQAISSGCHCCAGKELHVLRGVKWFMTLCGVCDCMHCTYVRVTAA